MASKWSRTKYDDCRIQEDTHQSVSPMDYRLYPGRNQNCSSCLSLDGPRSHSESTTNQPSQVVDVESKLKNIDGKYNSRACKSDPRDYFSVGSDTRKMSESSSLRLCDRAFDTVPSRLDVPDTREVVTWEYNMDFPQIPPQDNVNFMEETSSRLLTKDVYDPQLSICREFKKMKDQRAVYPNEDKVSNDNCIGDCKN